MKSILIKSKITILILLIFLSVRNLYAQDNVFYINYGKQSLITSGDENYKQAFFIKVPESAPDKIYIRLFDPDCYGLHDEVLTVYNTETLFSLYGTYDILPDDDLLKQSADKIENESGELIYKKLYDSNFKVDDKWIPFAGVSKKLGEYSDGYYYFKLIVEGGYGTDGNVYDIFISKFSDSNEKVNGVELFSFSPNLRNAALNKSAQLKFYAEQEGVYEINSFDMDGAAFNYDTPLRSGIILKPSGDGKSLTTNAVINKFENKNYIGINFARFKDVENDAAVSVRNPEGKLLPISLPVNFKENNNRPIAVKEIIETGKWNERIFDASNTTDKDNDIIEYSWYFGDGSTSSGVKVNHVYEKSGTYNCILLAKDNSGNISNSSLLEFVVRINQPPVANAGSDIVVSSSEVSFDASASSDPDGNIIAYNWDFGDGSTGSGIKIKHVYALPGKYKVTLKVTDNSQLTNDKNSTSFNVTINKRPIADAGPDIITEPGKELFLNASGSVDPDGEIVSYLWDFGDGTTSQEITTTHTFTKPGKYNIRLEVKDSTNHPQAFDIDEAVVVVNSQPIADAGQDILAAPNQEIEFNAVKSVDYDGNKLSYKWEFSDGSNNSEKQIIKRSFAEPGLYKAVLTVTDNSGALNNKSTDEINIRINNQPTAKIGKDIFTCTSIINFDAFSSFDPDGDLLKYTWDFGDGSQKSNGIKVSHEYKNKGSFPVVLTVDDGNGLTNSINTNSITVIINQPPVADAGEDLTICSGEFVPFDGGKSYDPENGLLKYYWDFGDGTTAEGINPVKSFEKSGVYRVKLTVEDDSGLECNKDIDTKIITVIESPVANAGEDMQVCAFEEVQFDGTKSTDADGVVNSYTWDFGDGSTGGGAMPKHTYTKAGVYKVVLSITGETQGDCDNSSADEMTVIVNEAPEADFTLPSSSPVNTIVKLDASASNGKSDKIISYDWDFGDGETGKGLTVNHSFEKSGLYFVTLTVTTDSQSDCNSSSVVKSILINEAPVASAEAPLRVRVNTSINFSGLNSYDNDGAITSYKWNFGDGKTAEGVYAEHIYNETGNYKVTLEVKDNTTLSNNYAKDEITVEVYDDSKLSFTSVDKACPGEEIIFTAILSPNIADSLVTYNWEFGDGTSASGKNITHTFNNPGNYNVTLTAESGSFGNGETKVISKNISVNSLPVIDVQKLYYSCKGEEIFFDASRTYDPDGDLLSFKWEINGITKNGDLISYTFNKAGGHNIKLIVEDNSQTGCGKVEEEIKVIINSSPIIVTDKNINGFTGGAYDALLFDASKSYDEDGDALTYEWNFGDGEKGYGSKIFHNYKRAGNYSVTLKVSDGKNSQCSLSQEKINVNIKSR